MIMSESSNEEVVKLISMTPMERIVMVRNRKVNFEIDFESYVYILKMLKDGSILGFPWPKFPFNGILYIYILRVLEPNISDPTI